MHTLGLIIPTSHFHTQQDPPQKKSFKKTFVPPAPCSMFDCKKYSDVETGILRDTKVREGGRGLHVEEEEGGGVSEEREEEE
jgi:hypothetical protein